MHSLFVYFRLFLLCFITFILLKKGGGGAGKAQPNFDIFTRSACPFSGIWITISNSHVP